MTDKLLPGQTKRLAVSGVPDKNLAMEIPLHGKEMVWSQNLAVVVRREFPDELLSYSLVALDGNLPHNRSNLRNLVQLKSSRHLDEHPNALSTLTWTSASLLLTRGRIIRPV